MIGRNFIIAMLVILAMLCLAFPASAQVAAGIYLDDLQITNNGATVLSDNFDNIASASNWILEYAWFSSQQAYSQPNSLYLNSPEYPYALASQELSVANAGTVDITAWVYAPPLANRFGDTTINVYSYPNKTNYTLADAEVIHKAGESGYRLAVGYEYIPTSGSFGSGFNQSDVILSPETWAKVDLKIDPTQSLLTTYLNDTAVAQVTYTPSEFTTLDGLYINSSFGSNGGILLAGLGSDGSVWYTTDMATWQQSPGHFSTLVIGDFNGDGNFGLAGTALDETIWYTNDMQNWTQIPGHLQSLAVADVNVDYKDDLVGLADDGSIWYTTDKQTFHKAPGRLKSLVAGAFDKSYSRVGIAGLADDDSVWYTMDMANWTNIPGDLTQMVLVCNGAYEGELAGIYSDGSIWNTTDLATWQQVPGTLSSIVSRNTLDLGSYGIAGLASDDTIWYTSDMKNWTQIPGYLTSLVSSDFNDDFVSDLAGVASDGSVWYTTDMTNWQNIPGTLASICAPRR